MASVEDLVKDAHAEALHCVVETGGGKFVCFSRLVSKDAWVLGATDGCDVWRLELDVDDLDAQRNVADVSSLDAFLSRVKSAFVHGDVQVIQTGSRSVTLSIGQGSKCISIKLYEAKALDKKTDMQNLIIRLAEQSIDLETKLEKANKSLDDVKAQKGAGAGGLFDYGDNKKKAQAKAPPKQVGMSAVNPGSKKRKKARGVQFDEDDD